MISLCVVIERLSEGADAYVSDLRPRKSNPRFFNKKKTRHFRVFSFTESLGRFLTDIVQSFNHLIVLF